MSSPFILVGLGNPGTEYERTRHNAGFIALDHLRKQLNASDFQTDPKFFAELSTTVLEGRKIILAKPTTYMNESGKTARAFLDFYKLSPEDFVVLHDDLDIAPGTLRTTESSRSAGNNGVESIIEHLGTQDFFRIRIGIGRPVEVSGVCMPSHDYVLGRFSAEEFSSLEKLFPEIETIVRQRIKG